MSMSSTDKGLLTPANCAVIFIDYRSDLLADLANGDRHDLLNSLGVLARAARLFAVPVILTTVQTKEFSGRMTPQLPEFFPEQTAVERTSINAWDDPGFVAAVRKTGRRNFVLAGLWSEACLTFPALQMLEEGLGVYAVKDASRGTSQAAQETALRRVEQAGGVSVTALQVLLEFQRDWARAEHTEEVQAIVRERCRGDTSDAARAALVVHPARTNRKRAEREQEVSRKEINQ